MKAAYGILASAAAFVFCYFSYGTQVSTPFAEWVLVLYYANFFGIISFTNSFYETVHEKKVLAAFYVKDQWLEIIFKSDLKDVKSKYF